MVARFAADGPAPAKCGRGRNRAVADAEPRVNGFVEIGVEDVDRPGAAFGCRPGDAHVAAQAEAHAGDAGIEQLARDEIGREPLADAAGIETGLFGEPHAIAVDLDARRARAEVTRLGRTCRVECLERSVVSGVQDGAEHCRVEQAVGESVGIERAVHELDGLARHMVRVTGSVVQRTDLTRREEPAPPLLQISDAMLGVIEQTRIGVDENDMDVSPHRAKPALNSHGPTSPRSTRRFPTGRES